MFFLCEPICALDDPSIRRQPAECPDRGCTDQRRVIVETAASCFYQLRVARGGVADRDKHIAKKAVAAGALDGGSGKEFPERRIVERGEFGEPRRRQRLPRLKIGLARGPGKFVP